MSTAFVTPLADAAHTGSGTAGKAARHAAPGPVFLDALQDAGAAHAESAQARHRSSASAPLDTRLSADAAATTRARPTKSDSAKEPQLLHNAGRGKRPARPDGPVLSIVALPVPSVAAPKTGPDRTGADSGSSDGSNPAKDKTRPAAAPRDDTPATSSDAALSPGDGTASQPATAPIGRSGMSAVAEAMAAGVLPGLNAAAPVVAPAPSATPGGITLVRPGTGATPRMATPPDTQAGPNVAVVVTDFRSADTNPPASAPPVAAPTPGSSGGNDGSTASQDDSNTGQTGGEPPASADAAAAQASPAAAPDGPAEAGATLSTMVRNAAAQDVDSGTQDAVAGAAADPASTPGSAAAGMPGTAASPAATPLPASQPENAAFASGLPPLLPAEQLALAIGRLGQSSRSFSMQLKPEELGAVDVRLEIDAKGKARATFKADHPETLALLRQDSSQLLQALRDAGINADAAGLSFTLREQTGNPLQDRQESGDRPSAAGRKPASTPPAVSAEAGRPARSAASGRLYDIRA